MQTILRGSLRIDRVVETEGPTYPLSVLLPDLEPQQLEPYRDWLLPRFIDPESKLLQMSFHSFVLRSENHTILVDACVGNDKERPAFPEWHRQQTPYLERLAESGVSPEEIDFVFCTHLHPDHVGWNTRQQDDRWVPTFPRAKYLFARTELAHWEAYARGEVSVDPYPEAVSGVLRACYRDSVLPIVEAGRAILIDDGHELDVGIEVKQRPGHTPGNAVVEIDRGDFRAVLSGDVVHHPIQLIFPDQSSAFCFDPDRSRETRRKFLESHADRGTLLLPAHFPTPTAGELVSNGPGFRLNFQGDEFNFED